MNNNLNQLQSQNAEASVIGALILLNDSYDRISDVLSAQDFFHVQHQIIYKHIQRLAGEGKPFDVITLSESLKEAQLLDEAGGLSNLATIAKNTATADNIAAYADIVRKKAIRRKLSNELGEANDLIYRSQVVTEEVILDKVEQKILSIRQDIAVSEDELMTPKIVIPQIIDYLSAITDKEDGLIGLPTGFVDLDRKLRGLAEEQLVILAGRPSMGKTTFAMNIAETVLTKTDKSVLMFSMEMSARDIMMKFSASLGRVDFGKIRSANLDNHDWNLLTDSFDRAMNLNFGIIDKPALTPYELKHKARKFKREHPNLGLIVVDYLQLMQCLGYEKNRNLEVSKISNELKALAKELKVPVLALSQLNRGVEERADKKPMMSDLRDSGTIEQDADVVMFVYRPEVYYPDNQDVKGKANIIISKQRNGEIGHVDLVFRGEFCRFDNAEFSHRGGQ